jgi:hypothetical protein
MNEIKFNDKAYICRTMEIKGFGEVIISEMGLNESIMDKDGGYISKEAAVVDEKVFYYVDKKHLYLTLNELESLVLNEIV